jgi:hypothetical protein
MKTTFLESYKIILDKVRFDRDLLMKEYWKAIKQLKDNEIDELNWWLTSQGISQMLQSRNSHFLASSRRAKGSQHEIRQPVA